MVEVKTGKRSLSIEFTKKFNDLVSKVLEPRNIRLKEFWRDTGSLHGITIFDSLRIYKISSKFYLFKSSKFVGEIDMEKSDMGYIPSGCWGNSFYIPKKVSIYDPSILDEFIKFAEEYKVFSERDIKIIREF